MLHNFLVIQDTEEMLDRACGNKFIDATAKCADSDYTAYTFVSARLHLCSLQGIPIRGSVHYVEVV